MPQPPPLAPGSVIAGKYVLRSLLGTGGVGAVYAATNTAVGRRVAIKFLGADVAEREDVKKRFELEARAAAVIDHPGIVDVLDMGETENGEPFIVMEHLQGATLRSVFKALGPFSPGQATAAMAPVLDALGAAHRAGVIHRDIKPANIFLCAKPSASVKLLDFGISRFGESAGLTLTGTAVGTPRYMAPEQVLGEPDLGPETDLYSVGATLYHLLSGKPMHDADSDMATLAKLLTAPYLPLKNRRPELPDTLCELVDSLMARDRALRPKDADAVARNLRKIAPEEGAALFAFATRAADDEAKGTPAPASASKAGGPRSSAPSVSRRAPVDAATKELATGPNPLAVTAPDLPPVAEAPRRSSAPLIVGGLVVALLAVVAGVVVLMRAQAPELPPPWPPRVEVPVVAPVVVAPKSISLSVELEPSSARLTADGEKLECNPCVLERPEGTRLTVQAEAPGFMSGQFQLLFDANRSQRVTLTPVELVAPTVVAPKVEPPVKKVKKNNPLNLDERNPYQ